MACIRTIDEDEADEAPAQLHAAALDRVSRWVDNALEVRSLHPAGLSAHFALVQAVRRGTPGLPKVDRERIALVPSGARYQPADLGLPRRGFVRPA